MYVCMLAASIALGAAISRYFSEPLNRRLRGEMAISGSRARELVNQGST